jgi:three-Cys-motif partner protein
MKTATPPGRTWAIQPHTQTKLKILRSYLNAWFPILALGGFPRAIYIDGFAGPGRYTGAEDGSPLVALKAVLEQNLSMNSTFEFHFVEWDRECLARLKHEIGLLQPMLSKRSNVVVTIHEEQAFVDAYRNISPILGRRGTTVPIFGLLDPFGWTGVPFDILRDLLARPSTEVVVNFMHEEISRFLGQRQQPENFDALFGCREWRDALSLRGYERTYRLHSLYRDQLIRDAGARYVRSFTMVNERNRVDYFLFFATKNLLGVRKMKEAMWRVDRSGEFRFSDATDPDAPSLFGSQPDFISLQRAFLQRFGTSWTPLETLFEFTIAETPFLPSHARTVLREADKSQPPTIEVGAPKDRRGGTFPEGRGIRVRFR